MIYHPLFYVDLFVSSDKPHSNLALITLNFPASFIRWVMSCITIPTYFILINGSPHGFFEGKKGLRQGDPLSPLLFVIVMEILARLLKIRFKKQFFYPSYCKLGLSHLFFADDLLIFGKGNESALKMVISCLSDFSSMTGLQVNYQKSDVIFGGVDADLKKQLLLSSGLREGKLPFRYLGLPLNSKKLPYIECQSLIEKLKLRMTHWTTKRLSYAGRLQLLNSMIFVVLNFWCGVPILPIKALKELDKLSREFLWGSLDKRRFVFIDWKSVCAPKQWGGLHIKEVLLWSHTIAAKWLIHALLGRGSLWHSCISEHYVKNVSIWEVQVKQSDCIFWKELMKCRNHILSTSGNASDATELVKSWIPNGKFHSRLAYAHFLGCTPQTLRLKDIWGSFAVPKHSFITYLALRNGLASLDKIQTRGVHLANRCVLCENDEENLQHLFFKCQFATTVWARMLYWLNIRRAPLSLSHELRTARWVKK